MDSLSLIIPAYNEEKRLELSLLKSLEYCRTNIRDWEIIYVDDGSTDHTFEILSSYQGSNPELRILRHSANYGKGRAVRTGMTAAVKDVLLFSDADFSTPIEEAVRLYGILKDGVDVVIGSRGVPGANVEIRQSWIRETTGKLGNVVVQTLLPLPFEDTQCGFKMFRANAARCILPALTIDGFAFDIEMLVIAVNHGLKIIEAPVTWRNVLESKVKPVHNMQVLLDVFRIRYRLAMGEYGPLLPLNTD